MKNKRKAKVSINGMFVFGLILLALKLFGAIDWDWWIVLLPFYFHLVFEVGFLTFFIIIVIAGWLIAALLIAAAAAIATLADLWDYLKR